MTPSSESEGQGNDPTKEECGRDRLGDVFNADARSREEWHREDLAARN
jgi:hypothetical protein